MRERRSLPRNREISRIPIEIGPCRHAQSRTRGEISFPRPNEAAFPFFILDAMQITNYVHSSTKHRIIVARGKINIYSYLLTVKRLGSRSCS